MTPLAFKLEFSFDFSFQTQCRVPGSSSAAAAPAAAVPAAVPAAAGIPVTQSRQSVSSSRAASPEQRSSSALPPPAMDESSMVSIPMVFIIYSQSINFFLLNYNQISKNCNFSSINARFNSHEKSS